MLDRTATQEVPVGVQRRPTSDYLVALAFFGAVGGAMIAWIGAIAWVSWRVLEWTLS
ncbi:MULTISPECIES: hypothetical protein [unclassified Bradyrhizobium]|uniref:hypothetical protein n=1 Tax=unclassified Bradyrhizobium TaxID=2631580 RepID=UPI0024B14511|nr:hypothetical protein [Bradyrhizobium sp. CB2312]WFU70501.1 hypothetical protein QA642_35315 [Bradyrhizobium sp. CB2312]